MIAPRDRARVILDTNIFVAAGFNRASGAREIVRRIETGALGLVWHHETRSETEKILRRIPPLSWNRFAGLFEECGRYEAELQAERYGFVPDPADRLFLALAEATGTTLVTNDHHLLDPRELASVPVLTPREFLDLDAAP